jgi:hypothetical protein
MRVTLGLAPFLVVLLLCGCERQTAQGQLASLRPAKVSYLADGSALVSMDDKTYNYGFTGLEQFCLSGASLKDLANQSVADLERLADHYGLCLQDTNRADRVHAELAKRRARN